MVIGGRPISNNTSWVSDRVGCTSGEAQHVLSKLVVAQDLNLFMFVPAFLTVLSLPGMFGALVAAA